MINNQSYRLVTSKYLAFEKSLLCFFVNFLYFNSVGEEARISKATLYNNPEIRKRIESLREQQAQVPTLKQVKREVDENNKYAIIASLKRKIKKLDEENKELREQLKFAYAEVYKKF